MRTPLSLSLLVFAGASQGYAWHTEPHVRITQAALDTLPPQLRSALGSESSALAESYCMQPDRYVEMERFGFVRKSPGPRTAAEIRVYCVRPDGAEVHSASFDRDHDLASLIYLFERIASSLSAKQPAEAARYMGTLSHFIADSLSPPHSVPADDLLALQPPSPSGAPVDVHAAIERTLPALSLGRRSPRIVGNHLTDAAENVLNRVYAAAAQNRKDLPVMVRAACAGDQSVLDGYRRRAGTAAAELLADALFTLLTISSS